MKMKMEYEKPSILFIPLGEDDLIKTSNGLDLPEIPIGKNYDW